MSFEGQIHRSQSAKSSADFIIFVKRLNPVPVLSVATSSFIIPYISKPSNHTFPRKMNGCFNASAGVHLLSGFKLKHLSSKSTNRFNSFISTSSIPFMLANNLVLMSRVGLVRFKMRTTSFPLNLSFCTLRKFNRSSKCKPAN